MRKQTVVVAEMALTLALAAVLNRFAVFQMPFGGSISLDMLPIIVFALRRGPALGVACGAVYGFVDFVAEPFVLPGATLLRQAAQVALDYPLAFGALGLAGLAAVRARPVVAAGVGGALGVLGRFVAHFASGVLFFASYAPEGQSPLVYSAIYNGGYLVPSAIACIALAMVVTPMLARAVPVARGAAG